jgi:hypothetical protein
MPTSFLVALLIGKPGPTFPAALRHPPLACLLAVGKTSPAAFTIPAQNLSS